MKRKIVSTKLYVMTEFLYRTNGQKVDQAKKGHFKDQI